MWSFELLNKDIKIFQCHFLLFMYTAILLVCIMYSRYALCITLILAYYMYFIFKLPLQFIL